jgi:hypothetical protein
VNYLAHGHAHVHSPYFVAGTALPDWLAAANRRARLRRKRLEPATSELARGVLRHLEDDAWFHASEAFQRASADVTDLLRAADPAPSFRAWFFGHVLVEMLLDAWLHRETPGRLDAYYGALDEVDPRAIEAEAGAWVTAPPDGLARFIDLFRQTRFLYGYGDDAGLFRRLEGVARRTRQPTLPPAVRGVLAPARDLVAERATELLAAPSGAR